MDFVVNILDRGSWVALQGFGVLDPSYTAVPKLSPAPYACCRVNRLDKFCLNIFSSLDGFLDRWP